MPPSITQSQLLPILAAIVAFLFAALLLLYIFRLLFGRRIRAPGPRNRPRRLDIVDTFELDRERQLVIVRRDNVEHLLLIGGPNDLLVEATINRGEPRALAREKEAAAGGPAWPQPPGGPSQPQPLGLGAPTGEPPKPKVEPPPVAAMAPLPPDLFAPTPAKPAPPEAAQARPTAPSRFTPSRTGFTPTPRPPRQPPPPFLSRAQRAAAATPPPAAGEPAAPPLPPAPATPPPPPAEARTPEPEPEPAPGPVEPPPPPAEAAPSPPPPRAEDPPPAQPEPPPADPLESLEAEMARLLGRPDGK